MIEPHRVISVSVNLITNDEFKNITIMIYIYMCTSHKHAIFVGFSVSSRIAECAELSEIITQSLEYGLCFGREPCEIFEQFL